MSMGQRYWNHLCWVHRPGEEIIYSNGDRFVVNNSATKDDVTFMGRGSVVDSALILGQTPSGVRDGLSIRKMFQGFLSELNIWDRQLSRAEMESMSLCKTFPRGNLVSWDKDNLHLKNPGLNLQMENVPDLETFCRRRQYLIVPKISDLRSAYDQCKTFGGHIATPENTEENQELLRLVKTFPECLSKYKT